jgi:hypothetical protein
MHCNREEAGAGMSPCSNLNIAYSMNSSPLRDVRLIAAFTAALLGAAFTPTPTLAAAGSGTGTITYSGQAVALKIDGIVNPTAGQIVIADTGSLPGSGGTLTASQSNVNLHSGALTIDHASAMATGIGPEAAAESTLVNYHVEFISHDGLHVTVNADYVYGRVAASVDKNGKVSVDTQVIVEGLTVNGRPVTVTGRPNQIVDIPEAETRLIINEQLNSATKNSADVAVSPIHFEVCECIEGHMGLVRAGITVTGTPPPPEDCGKITGGGWINTPSSAKGTFGMSGGIRRGEYWGHLQYIDHGTGMNVSSTAVTNFQVDGTARIITYAVTINGAAGTARLRVVDNGEPGRNDIFDLTLSNGYHAAGDLGGSRPGGGNIQLHKCPPGWE